MRNSIVRGKVTGGARVALAKVPRLGVLLFCVASACGIGGGEGTTDGGAAAEPLQLRVRNSIPGCTGGPVCCAIASSPISYVNGQVPGLASAMLFSGIPNGTTTPHKVLTDASILNNDFILSVTATDPWGNPSTKSMTVQFTSPGKWLLEVKGGWCGIGDQSAWVFQKE